MSDDEVPHGLSDSDSPEPQDERLTEFLECLDSDLELELEEFRTVVRRLNLSKQLTDEEFDLVGQVWELGSECSFLLSGPQTSRVDPGSAKIHEAAVTHVETQFLETRNKLRSTVGWQGLSESIRREVEDLLLAVKFEE